MRALALIVGLISCTLFAGDSVEPREMLAVRGKVLKEESFNDSASITKGNKGGWGVYKGKFEIVDGQMKISEQKEDGHHPAMSSKLPSKNLVMQCKFKVGESNWQGLSLDNGKEKVHVFRAMINKSRAGNSIQLNRMSGMGGTTKGERMAEKQLKLEPDKWYTLYVEIVDKEATLQIPEAGVVIAGEHEGIAMDKDRIEFISGGENAWFDELKVWEAAANPKWAEIKATIPASKPPAARK